MQTPLHRRSNVPLTQAPVILKHDRPRDGTHEVGHHTFTGHNVERVGQPVVRELLKPTSGQGRVDTLAYVRLEQLLAAFVKLSQTTVLHRPTLVAIPNLGSAVQRSQCRKIRPPLHKLPTQMGVFT
jgi:hypothetical protein